MGYHKIKDTRILITGGAGFIGSNLCEDFLGSNNQVVCLDNFSTGKRENIEPFLKNRNFNLIEGDIRDPAVCREAMTGIDLVLQQAALGSVPRSLNDPQTTNEVNVTGFLNVLMAAKEAGVKRFVYAASSSTYGDSPLLPKTEESIGKPLSPYAVSKYTNELYAHVFALNFGMTIVGLRYFNVYGRRQDPEGAYAAVIPKFIKQLMSHQSPRINGDGNTSRDFTYVDNVVQMNHLAAVADVRSIAPVYNTACGDRTDLNTLVRLLKRHLGRFDRAIGDIQAEYGPARPGDIAHSWASIEKARADLGYSPTHDLDRGIAESVDWYWHNLK